MLTDKITEEMIKIKNFTSAKLFPVRAVYRNRN